MRDLCMCINVFEKKIVKSVWKWQSSKSQTWIAFSALLRHTVGGTLTSVKLVMCGPYIHIYTKKGKVCFEITGWGQPLVRAEKQGFSAGASFWADLNCPPCSTNAEISLQHFFSFKIADWVWKYCMIWEGGEEVGKTAFYSLHKCCLFSCDKPVKLEVANENHRGLY